MITNLLGAIITFTVLSILFLTKFGQVWSVLVFLPIIVFIFHRIRRHYDDVGEQLRIDAIGKATAIEGNVVIVPVAGITKVVEQSINYAESIGDRVFAVYVAFDREDEIRMKKKSGSNGSLTYG
ncbi:hypothetical protein GCM10020331_042660 [Ectobacillus funiculus]